ncbi:MAG: SLOG family protein [Saprospiraceae bacterium]
MKLLFTGSRQLTAAQTIALLVRGLETLQQWGQARPTLLLHGGAIGADTYAEEWAQANGMPTEIIRPDYIKQPHRSAALIRNTELVARAEVTLALYAPGQWRRGGTWDTAQKTVAAGKPLLEMEGDSQRSYYTPVPLLLC